MFSALHWSIFSRSNSPDKVWLVRRHFLSCPCCHCRARVAGWSRRSRASWSKTRSAGWGRFGGWAAEHRRARRQSECRTRTRTTSNYSPRPPFAFERKFSRSDRVQLMPLIDLLYDAPKALALASVHSLINATSQMSINLFGYNFTVSMSLCVRLSLLLYGSFDVNHIGDGIIALYTLFSALSICLIVDSFPMSRERTKNSC